MGSYWLAIDLLKMDRQTGTSTVTQPERSENNDSKEVHMNEYLLGISSCTYFTTYQERVI